MEQKNKGTTRTAKDQQKQRKKQSPKRIVLDSTSKFLTKRSNDTQPFMPFPRNIHALRALLQHSSPTCQSPRIATLNVTHNNIQLHARTPPNSARNTIQNHKQRPKAKQKSRAFTLKIFFYTHTNPLSQTAKNRKAQSTLTVYSEEP